MSPYPIPEKLRAFGFAVRGDRRPRLRSDRRRLRRGQGRTKGKPFAIVMKTVKGKGVSFMENQAGWHGKAPNDEQYETAMAELHAQPGRTGGECKMADVKKIATREQLWQRAD